MEEACLFEGKKVEQYKISILFNLAPHINRHMLCHNNSVLFNLLLIPNHSMLICFAHPTLL